jgi:hypothetical protein
MTRQARSIVLSLLAASWLAAAPPSHAISIEGLQALVPLALNDVTATVNGNKLEIRHPAANLSIHPWPDYLPRKLDSQSIQAERQVWPAGPSDRISFNRRGQRHPWLILGSHSRVTTPLIAGWQLAYINGKWYADNGLRKILLSEKKPDKPATQIIADGERWQLYLLPDDQENPHSASITEHEPRQSWIAIRR